MRIALLDACVLFPNTLRDTLLRIAEHRLYRPLWSDAILDEVRRAVVSQRRVEPSRWERTRRLMTSAFEGSSVQGWENLTLGLDLPDQDDRHVLAAAIAGGAEVIITHNLSDFPMGKLANYSVEAIHPDEFLLDHLDLAPAVVISALREQASVYRRPHMDLSGLLLRLERCGVAEFANEVRRRVL